LAAGLLRHRDEMRDAWNRMPFAYEFHASRFLLARPADAAVFGERAIVRAEMGHSDEALADLQRANALEKDQRARWSNSVLEILVRAANGDERRARALIPPLLLATTLSPNAEMQLMMAVVATILPDAADGQALVGRIEAAVRRDPNLKE